MSEQSTRKIAFLVAEDGIEQSELVDPWDAVKDAGHEPVLISLESGEVQMREGMDKGKTQEVDKVVADVSVDDFDALVLPGGLKNPDQLRQDDKAVQFTKDFVASGKPVAAICHAPWLLVEADVVNGRTVTSYPSLETDITNAGGSWVDERVHVDGNLITSRIPDDLPAFNSALLDAIEHGSAATGPE